MSIHFGDVPDSSTLYIPFTSYDSSGASITISGFATSDILIYKNGSVTQRSSSAGFTLLDTDGIDFDGVTGLHGFSIDLSDNTDAGFYAVGSSYWVVVSTITVNGQTVTFLAATFTIVSSASKTNLARATQGIVIGTVGSGSTTTSIVTSSLDPAASATDQFKGRIVTFDRATTTAALRGQSTDITASTSGGVLTVTALSTAPVSGDTFTIT